MNLKNVSVENIQPCGYYVICQLVKVEETTESGIVLTSNTVNREQAGMPLAKVIAVGPAAFKNHESGQDSAEKWGFSEGDYVLINPHDYSRINCKEENIIKVIDYNITCKVEN